jgi:hypothetical protein
MGKWLKLGEGFRFVFLGGNGITLDVNNTKITALPRAASCMRVLIVILLVSFVMETESFVMETDGVVACRPDLS